MTRFESQSSIRDIVVT